MFFRLKSLFLWEPDADEFTAPLSTPAPFQMRIDRFPKGVDNAHIDVLLSGRFMDTTKRFVQHLLQYELGEAQISKRAPPPGVKDNEALLKAYVELMTSGTSLARRNSRPEVIQLLQFAVLKFLLVLVRNELMGYRDRLNQARAGQPTRLTVQLHDQLVAFARSEHQIHYLVVHKILLQFYKVEAVVLRKRRKSILGWSWPVPKEVLFNPLLQLPTIWAEEQLMRHYTLLGTDKEDLHEFDRINRLVFELFGQFLPPWAAPRQELAAANDGGGENDSIELRERIDQGLLNGFLEVELLLGRSLQEDEYRSGQLSWLDEPENISILVRVGREALRQRRGSAPSPQERRKQLFHRHLLEKIYYTCDKWKLVDKVLAAREAPAVYGELRGMVPVRLILHYLEGRLSRRNLLRRLAGIRRIEDPNAMLRLLDQKRSGIRRLPRSRKEEAVIGFLGDFLALRRDLKLAYRAYWVMNQLRLLERKEEIELSRNNGSLYEFLLPDEQAKESTHQIRGHVILKADLRGSTTITAQLREKNLNPASHFSLNFFGPITKLLTDFGAKKVFVEGDAVILAIYEYEDAPTEWLGVSRACGLARQMLNVVDAQNVQNRKYDLPDLELGLGISYRAEPPAFLYDGDHEIMISSAINRADRLSSCAAALRATELGNTVGRGVEVVEPVDQGIMQKDSSDKLLRYNVNGVELDSDAFFKLKTELALHRIKGSLSGYSPRSSFYVGRYPDRKGRINWLVVREAPIRLWIGNSVSTEEQGGRLFYEVVTKPEVLPAIKERISQREGIAQTTSGLRRSGAARSKEALPGLSGDDA